MDLLSVAASHASYLSEYLESQTIGKYVHEHSESKPDMEPANLNDLTGTDLLILLSTCCRLMLDLGFRNQWC